MSLCRDKLLISSSLSTCLSVSYSSSHSSCNNHIHVVVNLQTGSMNSTLSELSRTTLSLTIPPQQDILIHLFCFLLPRGLRRPGVKFLHRFFSNSFPMDAEHPATFHSYKNSPFIKSLFLLLLYSAVVSDYIFVCLSVFAEFDH